MTISDLKKQIDVMIKKPPMTLKEKRQFKKYIIDFLNEAYRKSPLH